MELKPIAIPNSTDQTRFKEIQQILDNLNNKDYVILLTETVKQFNSTKFTDCLDSLKISQHGRVNFIIGGACGIDIKRFNNANLLSLSLMTFPHQSVRLILLEQIYRTFTIIEGHRYHH